MRLPADATTDVSYCPPSAGPARDGRFTGLAHVSWNDHDDTTITTLGRKFRLKPDATTDVS
jgi:hypothetical protein